MNSPNVELYPDDPDMPAVSRESKRVADERYFSLAGGFISFERQSDRPRNTPRLECFSRRSS
jgi:hypothetical protein